MGAFRYYTTPDCVRHWQWFAKAGPAEIVRGLVPACVRGAALALPLLAAPGAAGPAYAPPVPVAPLPWIAPPGWLRTALPFFEGGFGYAPGFGYGAHGLQPLGASDVALAAVAGATPGAGTPALMAEGPISGLPVGGRPMPPADTAPVPQPVPSPGALCVLPALVALAVGRRGRGR